MMHGVEAKGISGVWRMCHSGRSRVHGRPHTSKRPHKDLSIMPVVTSMALTPELGLNCRKWNAKRLVLLDAYWQNKELWKIVLKECAGYTCVHLHLCPLISG